MEKVAVVAVGGNALTREDQEGTAEQIEANAVAMTTAISHLLDNAWRVVVVHGNGPQVGSLAIQQEGSVEQVPAQPLYSLNAMSQGQLGSVLVRAIDSVRGPGSAVTVVTHACVDPDDAAFSNPTKPIGPFFSESQAETLAAERGWVMVEDSGRGHRRVVPSPVPLELLETSAVRSLLDAGHVVLAAGGGGVAVTRGADGRYEGVDAVIDKDFAASRLAVSLGAETLLLVTGVEAVSIDFGTLKARVVNEMSLPEGERFLDEGQFPPGSMGPKVRAALDFVRETGGTSIITSADHVVDALAPRSGVGTRIAPASVMSPA